jgi:hypothetical protein
MMGQSETTKEGTIAIFMHKLMDKAPFPACPPPLSGSSHAKG